MTTTSLASKPAATDASAQVAAFLRAFWAATPAAIFLAAIKASK